MIIGKRDRRKMAELKESLVLEKERAENLEKEMSALRERCVALEDTNERLEKQSEEDTRKIKEYETSVLTLGKQLIEARHSLDGAEARLREVTAERDSLQAGLEEIDKDVDRMILLKKRYEEKIALLEDRLEKAGMLRRTAEISFDENGSEKAPNPGKTPDPVNTDKEAVSGTASGSQDDSEWLQHLPDEM